MTDRDLLLREKARIRNVGAIILIVGLISAGLVYWVGTRAEDSRLNEYAQSRNRAEQRQLDVLFGRSGKLVSDFSESAGRPIFKAAVLAAITVVLAGSCFYLGRPLNERD